MNSIELRYTIHNSLIQKFTADAVRLEPPSPGESPAMAVTVDDPYRPGEKRCYRVTVEEVDVESAESRTADPDCCEDWCGLSVEHHGKCRR